MSPSVDLTFPRLPVCPAGADAEVQTGFDLVLGDQHPVLQQLLLVGLQILPVSLRMIG